jgi:hypothetical protein
MRRMLKGLVLAPLVVVLSAGAAFASAATGQANGNGASAEGNTVGFNAKADMSGQFQYVSHDQTFRVHCDGYTSYSQRRTAGGDPVIRVTGTCTDQAGSTIYMEAYFIDRGEPGTKDSERIYFSYVYHADLDNFPADLFLADAPGHIDNGNIQIHLDPRLPAPVDPTVP